MSSEVLIQILSIIGVLCILGLSVNAFFIKSLVKSIDDVKTYSMNVDKNVAVLASNEQHMVARITNVEDRAKHLEKSDGILREGLHNLRSELAQRVQAIELRIDKA